MSPVPLPRSLRNWLSAIAALLAIAAVAPAARASDESLQDPSGSIAKNNGGPFFQLHESFLARGKAGPVGVLFLGDSITYGWRGVPHIWNAYYGKYDPANFGIGGDRTQNVIWRIDHGELDGLHPKVVVLMLGTNNSADNTGAQIAAADKKIIDLIRTKIPQVKVLLLAIFPRSAAKTAQGLVTDAAIASAARHMSAIDAANAQLARLDDGRSIRFLDIGKVFLGQDGRIPFTIMADQLHPTAAGYQLWADAMKPLLAEMMTERAPGS